MNNILKIFCSFLFLFFLLIQVQAKPKNIAPLTDADITGFWKGEAESPGGEWSSGVFFQLEAVDGKIIGKEKFSKRKKEWKLNLTGYYRGREIYLEADNGTNHHWELVKRKPNKLIVEGNYSGEHIGSLELRKKW
jgi:hypothetical protein